LDKLVSFLFDVSPQIVRHNFILEIMLFGVFVTGIKWIIPLIVMVSILTLLNAVNVGQVPDVVELADHGSQIHL